MFDNTQQQVNDIDWFFTNNEHIAFIASGGGQLPRSVNKSLEIVNYLSTFFRNLPEISEVVINPNLNSKAHANEKYLSDFVFMTKRGLYSFDKSILNDFPTRTII